MSPTILQPNHQPSDPRGFTVTELLVVIAMLALLGTVALASSHRANQHVLLAACAENQRQIGVGLSVYSAEQNGYVPICGWAEHQNPWQTYEVARGYPGTTNYSRGFVNLGLLTRTKALTDPRLLYCPAQTLSAFTYDYYATTGYGWPVTPVGSGDDNIRAGYSYYPQLRALENIGFGRVAPELNYAYVQLEFGSGDFVAPMKLSELDPSKSIATDLVHYLDVLPHRTQGELAGLNALFPDGTVSFQNARTNPEFFPLNLWQNIGSDPTRFRFAMNNWRP